MEFEELVGDVDFMSPTGLFSNNKLTSLQNELLRFVDTNHFSIVYKRRQTGVSTAISIYMLWLLINNSRYSIAIMFSTDREREIFREMININLYRLENVCNKHSNTEKMFEPKFDDRSRTVLPNGSTIYYWSKKSKDVFLGHSLDFIYISELMFQDNFTELVQRLYPCIALKHNGKFVVTTTELRNIKDDFFMNGDGVSEYWCDFFDGRRFVIVEKYRTIKAYEF